MNNFYLFSASFTAELIISTEKRERDKRGGKKCYSPMLTSEVSRNQKSASAKKEKSRITRNETIAFLPRSGRFEEGSS